jgi:glutamate-1-semialdehyde 2,1-aminomutase
MGVVAPVAGFLEGLRRLTRDDGSLLIFDEVITGFRVARGGAQELYGVTPDLTCLGKVLGGGLPVGAYGGRRELMEQVAPAGAVYQAGTLSGNPLAVAAGLATLQALDDRAYRRLDGAGARVAAGLQSAAAAAGIPLTVNRVGSMLTAFFTDRAVRDYASAKQTDTESFARWFQRLLAKGVSLPPSQFEAIFVSTAHDEEALTFLEASLRDAFNGLRAAPAQG